MAPSVFKAQFPLTQGSIKQTRLCVTKLRSIYIMTYLQKNSNSLVILILLFDSDTRTGRKFSMNEAGVC